MSQAPSKSLIIWSGLLAFALFGLCGGAAYVRDTVNPWLGHLYIFGSVWFLLAASFHLTFGSKQ